MTVPPGIRLELTPEQYRQLVLASYLGAAMIQTARDELSAGEEPAELSPELEAAAEGIPALMQTVLAAGGDAIGAEREEGGELIPDEELENTAVDCADIYAETVFWNRLAEGLAERDLEQLRAQNRPLPEGPDGMTDAGLLENLIEMYLEEFSENGLDNIMIPLLDENEMSHPN